MRRIVLSFSQAYPHQELFQQILTNLKHPGWMPLNVSLSKPTSSCFLTHRDDGHGIGSRARDSTTKIRRLSPQRLLKFTKSTLNSAAQTPTTDYIPKIDSPEQDLCHIRAKQTRLRTRHDRVDAPLTFVTTPSRLRATHPPIRRYHDSPWRRRTHLETKPLTQQHSLGTTSATTAAGHLRAVQTRLHAKHFPETTQPTSVKPLTRLNTPIYASQAGHDCLLIPEHMSCH